MTKMQRLFLNEHPFRAPIGTFVMDHAFFDERRKEILDLVPLLVVIQGVRELAQ